MLYKILLYLIKWRIRSFFLQICILLIKFLVHLGSGKYVEWWFPLLKLAVNEFFCNFSVQWATRNHNSVKFCPEVPATQHGPLYDSTSLLIGSFVSEAEQWSPACRMSCDEDKEHPIRWNCGRLPSQVPGHGGMSWITVGCWKLQDIYAVCMFGGVSFYVLSTSLGAKFVRSSVTVTTFCRLTGSPSEVTCMKFYLPVSINCRDMSL